MTREAAHAAARALLDAMAGTTEPYCWYEADGPWFQVHTAGMASYTYYRRDQIKAMAKDNPRMAATLRDIDGDRAHRRADDYYCDAF